MSKKMKITLTAAVMAVIMLVMSVAVYAAAFNWYKELAIASGTQILKGSLQTNKPSDYSEFTTLYSTLRYDPSGTAGPGAGYQGLDLKIEIKTYRFDSYDNPIFVFEDEAEQLRLAEGIYINTPSRNVSGQQIDLIIGTYQCKTPNSTNYTMGFTIDTDEDPISF